MASKTVPVYLFVIQPPRGAGRRFVIADPRLSETRRIRGGWLTTSYSCGPIVKRTIPAAPKAKR